MLTGSLLGHSQRCAPCFNKHYLHGSSLRSAVGVPRVPNRCIRPVAIYQCCPEVLATGSGTSGNRWESELLLRRRSKSFGPPFGVVSPARRRLARHGRHISVQSSAIDVLLPLGLDFLTFLCATVLVIPVFKSVGASPVLGFLFSGLLLGQLGLFRSTEELEKLSELGVLFLLFEMGLELSLDRLKSLAKYAFGLGTVTMLISTLTFTALGLPVGEGLGTQILVKFFNASPELAGIRSLDEAVVIGGGAVAFILRLRPSDHARTGPAGLQLGRCHARHSVVAGHSGGALPGAAAGGGDGGPRSPEQHGPDREAGSNGAAGHGGPGPPAAGGPHHSAPHF
eukprot:jgi/Botrbrau1/7594/Bobra.0159s0043.1